MSLVDSSISSLALLMLFILIYGSHYCIEEIIMFRDENSSKSRSRETCDRTQVDDLQGQITPIIGHGACAQKDTPF
jgi:hypothetical protein